MYESAVLFLRKTKPQYQNSPSLPHEEPREYTKFASKHVRYFKPNLLV